MILGEKMVEKSSDIKKHRNELLSWKRFQKDKQTEITGNQMNWNDISDKQ